MTHQENQGGAEWQRRQEFGGVAEQQRGQGVLGTVAGAAQGAASAAEQAWETTSHGVQQAASAVAHTAEDAWGSVRSCMSRYPLAVFFTGMALGALAVLAFERR